jgi:exosortase
VNRATLQDLGLALLVGTVVAVGPFTPARWGPSAVAAVAAGAVALWLRVRTARPVPASEQAPWTRPLLASLRRSPLPWLSLLLAAALFAPTIAWMFERWTASIWANGHGLLVPFLMLYLGAASLRRARIEGVESSAWGLPVVALGAGLAVVDAAIGTGYVSAIALVVCLPGLSLLLLGPRRTRALALPLALGIFMVPISDSVATHLPLRAVTGVGVEWMLERLGFLVLRVQTALVLPEETFRISNACSGFAALYAGIGAAVLFAVYSRSAWRRAALLGAVVPLALVSNMLRVLALVLLVRLFGVGLLDTPIHELSGMATFWLVLALLFGMADRQALRAAVS